MYEFMSPFYDQYFFINLSVLFYHFFIIFVYKNKILINKKRKRKNPNASDRKTKPRGGRRISDIKSIHNAGRRNTKTKRKNLRQRLYNN